MGAPTTFSGASVGRVQSGADTAPVGGARDYGQLTTTHVRELVFPAANSRTTCDRVLRRLLADGYVATVSRRRLVRGRGGGSGEHVWELGPTDWRLTGVTSIVVRIGVN
jgi:hypothetical protein